MVGGIEWWGEVGGILYKICIFEKKVVTLPRFLRPRGEVL